ncbi:phytanoyl-CoA dioxygenase family protein [soil metagenome]
MLTKTIPPLYYRGNQLKTSPAYFGELHDSTDIINDAPALRQRMADDGYLYLPGLLDRDKVLEARRSVLQRLWDQGSLDTNYPLMDGVAKAGVEFSYRPDLAAKNPEVETVIYTGEMMHFFNHFLGGTATHFDYTWLRAKMPGANTATQPHCDIVYMSRGTKQLYTAWTPLGDVSYELGGLMVLEGSSHKTEALGKYWEVDVDAYCENGKDSKEHLPWTWHGMGGAFDKDAIHVREQVGGRWLSHEYRAGDVLIFSIYTMHASLDNQTNQVRLSTDTRYQLASEPLDQRWIGENPIAHGDEAKVGMIC